MQKFLFLILAPQPDSDIYDDTTDVPPPLPSMPWNPPPAASTDEM